MLIPIPPIYRPGRRPQKRPRKSTPTPPPPPEALTLVSAWYDHGGFELTLTFGRAVNIDAFNGFAVMVSDGVYNALNFYAASAGLAVGDPTTVKIVLTPDTPASGEQITLTASAASGIVAEDDGGTWPGVTELVLPFP
jgi:hypothetical protein